MIRVVDIETTGLDPAVDRIVEIAIVGVDFERRSYRKLYHSLARIRSALEALADPAIPFAAHNAAFDSAFLKPVVPAWTAPWICTLRIARHLSHTSLHKPPEPS